MCPNFSLVEAQKTFEASGPEASAGAFDESNRMKAESEGEYGF
ncbi:MAG: hypothetical protein NZV14_00270 [Bryobacteraceae bacterium]|nr:hypothetical protein [Bryobacteraceae bacterium]MDW8376566.1 hypothetical protein [Bryobacterales bacterium]